MKIYTKTGDNGTTGLFAGPRVPKHHPRIQAYGAVDELNAVLGVVVANMQQHESANRASEGTAELLSFILDVQNDLFSIGAQLATPEPEKHGMCLLSSDRTNQLEGIIDQLDAGLPPLANFILPGGTGDSAMLHLARTVCRRAERDIVAFAHSEPEDREHGCDSLVVYLNRLSDLLFLMARRANHIEGVDDTPWAKPS